MATSRLRSIFSRQIFSSRTFQDFRFYSFVIISWLPAVIFFNSNVGGLVWVNGPSMYPYLNSSFNEDMKKDVCWNKKWNARKGLERGMIVSFRSPRNPETLAVKRVIALEGDTVYTRPPCPVPVVHIPKNHIWVEGDNRDAKKTLDSNTYGPVSVSLVEGQITNVLLPLKSFGPVRWDQFRGRTVVVKRRNGNAMGWD